MDISALDYKGRILVIDDDEDTRNIYVEILTNAGYRVDVAFDGEEGLNKILENEYDLILLDIIMPKLDGLGLLRQLKERNGNLPLAPIVMLSALDQDQIVNESMELGAKGFIKKSDLTPDQALTKIAGYITNIHAPV